ncbi:hypothetical protein SAMN05444166_4170 [Singulisphaera sp. GP187]|uniref:hypothetical protein n=1 Tax=Singulisphaera sp. GP187 TaxID=1882752 RepID=UPI0009261199|nr:hypothetical protein [Singulisphaera sp. GP187]SIO37156.1 hypothetical protein SAMN05444166_4170 [Singulisphaera sp. GP187]
MATATNSKTKMAYYVRYVIEPWDHARGRQGERRQVTSRPIYVDWKAEQYMLRLMQHPDVISGTVELIEKLERRVPPTPKPRDQQSHRIEFNGQSKTYTEWAAHSGVSFKTIWNRLHILGWSVEKTLSQPSRKRRAYV